MTRSQRTQFVPIPSSQDLRLAEQESAYLDDQLQQFGAQKSSGAETVSTIAYATPSEFASHRGVEEPVYEDTQPPTASTPKRKRKRKISNEVSKAMYRQVYTTFDNILASVITRYYYRASA